MEIVLCILIYLLSFQMHTHTVRTCSRRDLEQRITTQPTYKLTR